MMDLGIGEAVPDVVIEIATFGFGRPQLLVNLHGNAEVAVDRSASAASASARTRRAGEWTYVSSGDSATRAVCRCVSLHPCRRRRLDAGVPHRRGPAPAPAHHSPTYRG